MDLSVDLFYEDQNHDANINVLRIRRKIRDDSNPLELPSAKMIQSREIGLIKRLLHQRQPKKPECQSLYTVYPVNFFGIADAFIFLSGGFLISLLALGSEILRKHYYQCN